MTYANLQRIKTVAKAAVTWLVIGGAVLSIVASELAGALGADHVAVQYATTAATALGVALAIIRQVTPVLPDQRGILPKGGPVTERERLLVDELAQR